MNLRMLNGGSAEVLRFNPNYFVSFQQIYAFPADT